MSEAVVRDRAWLENRVTKQAGSGCWIWTGFRNKAGYGMYGESMGGIGKHRRAHRLAYRLFRGEIASPLVIDHLCRVRACVNPWHMELVPRRVNVLRGIRGVLTTHCPKGHAYTPDNLLKKVHGRRDCKTCHMERERRRRRAAREAHAA
jgi:hypothetical protein